MTPSPRSFSTISVAVIVLSATLSVFLSPNRSVAQSTADVTTVSLISPHHIMTPNITTKIACSQQQTKNCRKDMFNSRCKVGSLNEETRERRLSLSCINDYLRRCMLSCGG
jgi:hypothetical protein